MYNEAYFASYKITSAQAECRVPSAECLGMSLLRLPLTRRR